MALTDKERAILDFERSWWLEPGPKEAAIQQRLHLSSTSYYRVLAELVDSDDALSYDPLVVRRVRRLRERRRRARYERQSSGERPGR
jgi:hypothetical protein